MRAVVVRETGSADVLRMETIARPTPAARDVLIRVAACGVCTLDVVTRNGTYRRNVELPIIPGHEIAGTVMAVGSEVRRFRVGDRVATTQRYHICGACRYCRGGYEPLCEERRFLGQQGLVGGYAEYVAVEEDNVAVIPAGVSEEQAAIAACAIGTTLNAVRDVGRVKTRRARARDRRRRRPRRARRADGAARGRARHRADDLARQGGAARGGWRARRARHRARRGFLCSACGRSPAARASTC